MPDTPVTSMTEMTSWTGDELLYAIDNPSTVPVDRKLALTTLLQKLAIALQTAGGNARGSYAVDLQVDRTLATEVASGDHAVLTGGWINTVSGDYAGVLGGLGNQATGDLSAIGGGGANLATKDYAFIPGGEQALADKWAQNAHAGGMFNAVGDAQASRFVIRRSVTHSNANWYQLYGDGAAERLTIASNTVWTFSILIVGTTSGCTKSFGFKIEGVVENDGGTTTILASTVTTIYDTDDTDFDARVSADDANDALLVEVQDSTSGGDVVRWVAVVETVEVNFP